MTEDVITALFEEWKRRWQEEPESFMSWEASLAEPPETYGASAAKYFLHLLAELYEYELEIDRYVRKT